MNDEERDFFSKLVEDRKLNSAILAKKSMKGIKRSVVEKYSDKAHFIYELLQNADDSHATEARFVLREGGLVFAHNGSRHFSITDPGLEDTEGSVVGDVNAITSIGNSTKEGDSSTIGKFGVGFKAVFQYTSTPRIYDPGIRFMISDFIVPSLISDDHPDRRYGETLFDLPFDNDAVSVEDAFSDIEYKLRHLVYPTMFLTDLRSISIRLPSAEIDYSMRIVGSRCYDDVTVDRISISNNGTTEMFWKFSRSYQGMGYSVVFKTDEGMKLVPVRRSAFCFFPTRHDTGLNFMVHAPFLLTDSREGIKAFEQHNVSMVKLLASLAAKSLSIMRDIGVEEGYRLLDDNILEIIPVNPNSFKRVDHDLTFRPVYDEILSAFQNEPLLPTIDGYVGRKDAYWSVQVQTSELFSDEQLGQITGNENARWVFRSIPDGRVVGTYIRSIVAASIDDAVLFDSSKQQSTDRQIIGLTSDFIESQSIDWLHRLYEWMGRTKERTKMARILPIFLDQDKKAASVFDKNECECLFLPNGSSEYRTVFEGLLENQNTSVFLEEIGMREPDPDDEIFVKIIPTFIQSNGENTDPDAHFYRLFEYYRGTTFVNRDRLCKIINESGFKWWMTDGVGSSVEVSPPSCIYIYSENLKTLFGGTRRYLDIAHYESLVGEERKDDLHAFLDKLGISKTLRLVDVTVSEDDFRSRQIVSKITSFTSAHEKVVDGLSDIITGIMDEDDQEMSFALWNCLLQIFRTKGDAFTSQLKGKADYRYQRIKSCDFDSSSIGLLREFPWIFDHDGATHPPSNMLVSSMDNRYGRNQDLQAFLKMVDPFDDTNLDMLTDDQRATMQLGRTLMSYGLSVEELTSIIEKAASEKKAKQQSKDPVLAHVSGDSQAATNIRTDGRSIAEAPRVIDRDPWRDIGNVSDVPADSDPPVHSTTPRFRERDVSTSSGYAGGTGGSRTIRREPKAKEASSEIMDDVPISDSDQYIPEIVDYSARIEQLRRSKAREEYEIEHMESLQSKALSSKRYTYGWFRTLLEMEILQNPYDDGHEVSISFGMMESDLDSPKTFVLKHPSRSIPQSIEEVSDFPMELEVPTGIRRVMVEAASIHSFELRVIVSRVSDMKGLDLGSVRGIRIAIQSPAFLDKSLSERWDAMGLDDDYDMKANMPQDVEFILGPPGTGKTTEVAKKVCDIVGSSGRCRILILTPTNKAADVITERIMDVDSGESYHNWLVRFGNTLSKRVEGEGILRERSYDIGMMSKCVMVTTVARYHYDHFVERNQKVDIDSAGWDTVIIDEASMIRLIDATYVLHRSKGSRFLISGDPFQIEPIVMVDMWAGENIYSMVGLNREGSFSDPHPEPFDFRITRLLTQYRSVPNIGSLFSDLTYGGLLANHRPSSAGPGVLDGAPFPVSDLNIVTFPVRGYEGVYRSKRLQRGSSYQIYSALFCTEFVNYLSDIMASNSEGKASSIGVISPYKVQADIVNKILDRRDRSNVVVRAGTIHGFQGDECDVMVVLLNPPPRISASNRLFLNRLNIINVAISRARDHLFVLVPDDGTADVNNLVIVNRLKGLMRSTAGCTVIDSKDVEGIIFGDCDFIEDNTFSTSHQNVNIYGVPHKRYEVRSDDQSIDVQIVEDGPGIGDPGHFNASV